jgi:hypothetical protein
MRSRRKSENSSSGWSARAFAICNRLIQYLARSFAARPLLMLSGSNSPGSPSVSMMRSLVAMRVSFSGADTAQSEGSLASLIVHYKVE